MYFAVIGKTPELSLAELELVHAQIKDRKGSLVFFDLPTQQMDLLGHLAGIIKRGRVVTREGLETVLKDVPLIGVGSSARGVRCKREFGVKRFKVVEEKQSDQEVREAGIELIDLASEEQVGLVEERQDIQRFEMIDFDKPIRGMQIGMMPAKLTQILLNIGIAATGKDPEDALTVYDPFVGFGTTSRVANSLGYHTIGSDINITPAKQNLKRWMSTPYASQDKHITLFKHNVCDSFDAPFLQHTDLIVTEGWLGPVVNQQSTRDQAHIQTNIQKIIDLYQDFLKNAKKAFSNIPIVMTIPVYLFSEDISLEALILGFAHDLGYDVQTVGEVYARKNQLVGRRVVIVK